MVTAHDLVPLAVSTLANMRRQRELELPGESYPELEAGEDMYELLEAAPGAMEIAGSGPVLALHGLEIRRNVTLERAALRWKE